MANANGWGDGASNNDIGWGKGADNAIGWGSVYSVSEAGATDIVGTPAVDPDAQAFITAAAITDPTQQAAINTLVVDLKGYSIWSKMKAIYPFVTDKTVEADIKSQMKFNLKDPRDLDVAFRLLWNGGGSWTANGYTPNGINGFADTKLATTGNIAQNSASMGVYSRTNIANTGAHGIRPASITGLFELFERYTDNNFYCYLNDSGGFLGTSVLDSRGFNQGSRTASNVIRYNRNTTTNTGVTNSNATSILTAYIGASNTGTGATFYNNREIAFFYIGDGLTNTEMQNYYTAVQAFQTTIGRSIGTQTVSDADAQAFVTAANIQDQVEANAINNLVIGMKADGLWSKMKAVYPFVGGSSSTMKFNLKNPLDTDAAFRLVFNGGWTFSSNGALPNGTNGYADTFLNASLHTSQNSVHLSYYSRTSTGNSQTEMGHFTAGNGLFLIYYFDAYKALNSLSTQTGLSFTPTNGMLIGSRIDSTTEKYYHKGVLSNTVSKASITPQNSKVFIGANNVSGSASQFSSKQTAFASIGDGLTDTEAANFYTAVQAFQVALSRNI